jgi:allophanate hydrolase
MNGAEVTMPELRQAYLQRKITPIEVVERLYSRIEMAGRLPVWISLVPFQQSLSAAQALLKASPELPLYGVPFAVKDNIDVAGLPTTAGCPEFAYMPKRHAFVVERLIDAGALVIGKTNLDQFATGLTGTRTPYGVCSSTFNAQYISGGSSSGSAVAVARGDVAFALGTDTAGSGRIPAAFNGLVGVKPTRGLLSTSGVVPACRSIDCVSIFARTLDDAERVLAVCAAYDVDDVFSRKPFPSAQHVRFGRIAVPSFEQLEFFGDAESAAAFRSATERLKELGWSLVSFDFELLRQAARLLYQGPWVAERHASVGAFVAEHPDSVHPVVRNIVEGARQYSASQAFAASYELAGLRRQLQRLWQRVDAIVLPTAPTHYSIEAALAAPEASSQSLGIYTNFANLLDLCALAVPAGMKLSGLPFGITWFGPAHEDSKLFECARARHVERFPSCPVVNTLGRVTLAVAGAHMDGQPLNYQLRSRGAQFKAKTTTAAEYRLFALNTDPPKPGLVHAPGNGQNIEVELWELELAAFGSFVSEIPAPMTIGNTRLSDGSLVKGFSCETHALEGAQDITEFLGWRAFLATLEARS